MAEFEYLTDERFDELFQALTQAGLARGAKLDALEEGIDPAFVSSLPESPEGNARLLSTLSELDRTERLVDGSVPFATWLRNAVKLAAGSPALSVIQRALVDVKARASGVAPAPDPTAAGGGGGGGGQEKIVQTNDFLPFGFLSGGALAGRSVARIQVDRFDGGRAATLPAGGPARYLGTGWLLTPSLLVTNHHVVNARNDGEPKASPADLDLQAGSLVAQFDFDGADAAPTEEHAATLEAYSPCDGPLDYAIVRLARDTGRAALVLTTEPIVIPAGDGGLALNIVQHPEGGPKMVACRNNLATQTTDTDVWYFTDTLSGSSGSPVLDDRWQVRALHKRWGLARNVTFQGKDSAWVNIGTQIAAILRDLESTGKAPLLAEIRAAQKSV